LTIGAYLKNHDQLKVYLVLYGDIIDDLKPSIHPMSKI